MAGGGKGGNARRPEPERVGAEVRIGSQRHLSLTRRLLLGGVKA
jgi:hypothetical protein